MTVPAMNTVNQIAMKFVAEATRNVPADGTFINGSWFDAATRSPWFYVIVVLEFLTFLVWLEVLKKATLSYAFSLTSVGYITVTIASWLVFDEKIGWPVLGGVILIISGVFLMSGDGGMEARFNQSGNSPAR